ncbi:hypothetical protein [Antarctobacter jejuensis]|uniref:hypothetical protein n=1 Tax=Antarctobacter jejuensis TaxID=1439938 RepID=UPI003FCF155F
MTARALITETDSALALERLAATARRDLYLAVPHLTPDTPLQIPELRERGLEVWADLIALLTRRGVTLRMIVADTDPLLTPGRHRAAWKTASGFADVVQGDAQVICAPHGQQVSGLWEWRLRRRYKSALTALRSEDPAMLTAVQRRILTGGPEFRPVEMPQSFALADDRACVIGGPDLALAIEDGDFCGALRGHFTDCWTAALSGGAQSLAAPAAVLDTPRRAQSRADLRLLRGFSRPAPGFGPRPLGTDHEAALERLFRDARHSVLVRTRAFRHDGLAKALIEAAGQSPDLQVILLLPPKDIHSWDGPRAATLQAQTLKALSAAFGNRLACVEAPGTVTTTVVVDDWAAVVGSAALTRRACRWNTEVSALVGDAGLAAAIMDGLGAAYLGQGTEPANMRDAAIWRATCKALDTGQTASARSALPDDLF